MNVEYEAANKFTSLALQGIELGGKMSLDAANHILKMIYHALTSPAGGSEHQKEKLKSVLNDGKSLKVYEIPENRMTDFASRAKKMGIEYFVIKDNGKHDGIIYLLSEGQYAHRINRILKEEKIRMPEKNCIPDDKTMECVPASKDGHTQSVREEKQTTMNEGKTEDTKNEKDMLPSTIRTRKIEGLGREDARTISERIEEYDRKMTGQRQYSLPTEPSGKEAKIEK